MHAQSVCTRPFLPCREGPGDEAKLISWFIVLLQHNWPRMQEGRGQQSPPEQRTPRYKGQNRWSQWCPLQRGSTVHGSCTLLPFICSYLFMPFLVAFILVTLSLDEMATTLLAILHVCGEILPIVLINILSLLFQSLIPKIMPPHIRLKPILTI